jgi:hypothetical protein
MIEDQSVNSLMLIFVKDGCGIVAGELGMTSEKERI